MQSNSEIRKTARERLSGNWGAAVGIVLFVFVIQMIIETVCGALDNLFNSQILYTPFPHVPPGTPIKVIGLFGTVSGIVSVLIYIGVLWISIDLARGGKLSFKVEEILQAFTSKISWKVVITYVLVLIYTTLWSLLLIVPGIIKGISYSLTFYIFKDNPDLSPNEAITLSRKMLDGYKQQVFRLSLSFVGMGLVIFIIAMILISAMGLTNSGSDTVAIILIMLPTILWLAPYMYTSLAIFYDDVKRNYESAKV